MAARITAAEAKRLGIDVPQAKARKRSVAKGEPYLTECHVCHERFDTQVAEDQHLDATRHHRYELVLTRGTP